jgi:hypothetical protein
MVSKRVGFVLVFCGVLAAPALAGFAGTDVFLPSVGRGPGNAGSFWYTTAWVYNPNADPVQLQVFLLERGDTNASPKVYTDTIPAGDTKRYTDAVYTLFGVEKNGALRFVSSARVIVNGRIYSQPSGGQEKDTVGQFFAAIPASFAIGLHQQTQLLGLYQTTPFTDSQYRYNFGFVETTGNAVTARVTVLDENGATVTSKDYPVGAFGALQYSAKNELSTLTTTNARLQVEVVSGSGKVVAFGSGLANVSNDPSTFEMAFRDELLAENASGGRTEVSHDASLTGAGTAAAPLGIAEDGVTAQMVGDNAISARTLADSSVTVGKIAATGSGTGKVLKRSSTGMVWSDDISGITLPYSGNGSTAGNLFEILATTGTAIHAVSNGSGNGILAEGGLNTGVVGKASGANSGVMGVATGSGGLGVYGLQNSSGNYGVLGSVDYGVIGNASIKTGVHAVSTSGNGLLAESSSATAVYAQSSSGRAVQGFAGGDVGVYGRATGSTGSGVYGKHWTTGNFGYLGNPSFGAYGENASGSTGYLASSSTGANGTSTTGAWGSLGMGFVGVYGGKASSGTTYAGRFGGNVQVDGNLSASGTKSFMIDHPLDPENRYLVHAAIESDEVLNVYSGNVTTDTDGLAVVVLPEWFGAINTDFRYQLTCIGRFAQAIVEQEIAGNRFSIRTNVGQVKVSWQVTARRTDAWMKAHPFQVEQDKPSDERGTYLAEWGQPPEKGADWRIRQQFGTRVRDAGDAEARP